MPCAPEFAPGESWRSQIARAAAFFVRASLTREVVSLEVLQGRAAFRCGRRRGPVVGKLERRLMALFEPIVLALASFLIDFHRALSFKPDSEAHFSRFLAELM